MTLTRRLPSTLALILLVAGSALSQTHPAILPLAEIQPGMKGVGRTIFQGDKIDEFQVEILGVLKNAIAPKRSLILARLAGGPLATTGVIAGMSGSPVYIDGKLVGAVSRSFPLSKEAIAGITPIEEMLSVVPSPATAAVRLAPNDNLRIATVSTDSGDLSRVIVNPEAPSLPFALPDSREGTGFANLMLPLRFGGFADTAVDMFASQFRHLGLQPMQGGVISGTTPHPAPSPTDLAPGSMISLLLVRGDLNLNIDCTVTLHQGDNLYACGHQVLAQGPAQFPFAPSHVIVTIPSIASSFKVDAPGEVVGTITQDRFDAIYGKVGGEVPRMIPVHLQLDSTLNRRAQYDFEMVQESFLSPILLNLALTSALQNTERALGTSTLNLKGKIALTDGESVNVEDVLSSEAGASAMVGATVATPLATVMSSGFPGLDVKSVDLQIESRDEKRSATLEQVWSTKSEVRPGDHFDVTTLIRLPGGATLTEKIPVDVPGSVPDKLLTLVIGGGSSINALEFRFTALGGTARDPQQLVRALNRMRRNNRVYALLMTSQRSFAMQGDEYPSPPPSLLQTFLADPAASSNVIFSGTSVVGDFETKPTPYAIHGQKTLMLKVVGG